MLSFINYYSKEDKLFLITFRSPLIITCVNGRLIQREIGFSQHHLSGEISNFRLLFSFQSCFSPPALADRCCRQIYRHIHTYMCIYVYIYDAKVRVGGIVVVLDSSKRKIKSRICASIKSQSQAKLVLDSF